MKNGSFGWRHLLLPTGRMNRVTYLLFLIAIFLVSRAISQAFGPHHVFHGHAPPAMTVDSLSAEAEAERGNPAIRSTLDFLLLYPWFCSAVNRLHDMGRGGIWLGLAFALLIAVLGYLVWALSALGDNALDGDYRGIMFGGTLMIFFATTVGGLILNLALLIIPGQKTANRYGPPATLPSSKWP